MLLVLQCTEANLRPRRLPAAALLTWAGSKQGMQGLVPGCRQRTQQSALQAAAHAGQHAARCPAQARAQPLTYPPLHETCSLALRYQRTVPCDVRGVRHSAENSRDLLKAIVFWRLSHLDWSGAAA